MRWKKLYIPCNSELGDRKNSRATRTRWAILVARLIRFIYYIYNYRLLYYLPMEMKDLEKELEKSVWEIIIDLQREVRELEEENKKLKEDVDYRHHRAMVAERGWEDED